MDKNCLQDCVVYQATVTKQQEQEQHEAKKVTKTCNCQAKKDPCPMDKNCLQDCVVYQATVTQTKTKNSENYIGLTADTFKVRHRNHKKNHLIMSSMKQRQS